MTFAQEANDLARSLLAYQAACNTTGPTESVAVGVCEKLREPLCAITGVAGYRSLLARALILARAGAPSLAALQVMDDGKLQSSEEPSSQVDPQDVSEGDILLTTRFVGLFLSLLGSTLTLRLMQDVFPNLVVKTDLGTITPFEDILKEVGYLNRVSDRLELLANLNPSVEEALLSVSGNVRNTATILEVLTVIKKKAVEPQKTGVLRRKDYMM